MDPLNELFSQKNSGAMRVFLFAKFYEDLLRLYLSQTGYHVLQGKPRVIWRSVPLPSLVHSNNHARLVETLTGLQNTAKYCTPDGLLVREAKQYLWEAKNWVQELYPSPFADRIWSFPWLLATNASYQGQTYPLAGFVISWWEREHGMDEALAELRRCVHPLSVEVIITKEVLRNCIAAQYPWYVQLVEEKRKNIDEFFDSLLGRTAT